MKRERQLEASYRACFWSFVAIVVLTVILLLTSCTTTRIVEVERVRTDTTYITHQQRDSIWMHDSIHIRERGDTVLIERWHTKYKERAVHDTTYVATHDTVPAPYPVIQEVPAELTWWQQARMHIGTFFLIAMAVITAIGLWKHK